MGISLQFHFTKSTAQSLMLWSIVFQGLSWLFWKCILTVNIFKGWKNLRLSTCVNDSSDREHLGGIILQLQIYSKFSVLNDQKSCLETQYCALYTPPLVTQWHYLLSKCWFLNLFLLYILAVYLQEQKFLNPLPFGITSFWHWLLTKYSEPKLFWWEIIFVKYGFGLFIGWLDWQALFRSWHSGHW